MYAKITQAPKGVEENRWHDNLTNDEHHSMKCISSSQLKFLHSGKSLENFYKNYITREIKPKFTDAFRVGTIAHLAVLEPEKFKKSVFVCDLDPTTNAYKEWRLALVQGEKEKEETIEKKKRKKADLTEEEKSTLIFTKSGGLIHLETNEEIFICSSEEMKMHRTFQERCRKHPLISKILSTSIIEQSGTAKDPLTGLWLSLRGDARNPSKAYFADPKTFDGDLTEASIRNYIKMWGLPIQAAHYCRVGDLIDGHGAYQRFFFIMMSKKAPYEIALVQLGKRSLEWGHEKCRTYLDAIHACELSGNWASVDNNKPIEIDLSDWELRT